VVFYLNAFLRIFGFSDQFYTLFGIYLTKKICKEVVQFWNIPMCEYVAIY